MKSTKESVYIPIETRIAYSLLSLFFICLVSLLLFFSWHDLLSFIYMKDNIFFSWRVFLFSFGLPIVFYLLFSIVKFCIINNRKPHGRVIPNLLSFWFIFSFIISFPISLYVDVKLKNLGYITCEKKSWISPNKYVKDINLCH
jgi:hypothetical protein